MGNETFVVFYWTHLIEVLHIINILQKFITATMYAVAR